MIYNKSLQKNITYTYDIKSQLNTNLHSIKLPDNIIHINVCIFNITFDSKSHNIIKPFLRYLLFKYPKSTKKNSDLLTLPFIPFEHSTTSSIVNSANKLASKILNYSIKSIGYTIHNSSIHFFFHHDLPNVTHNDKITFRNNQLWWSLIDEICNKKYILNFPIHQSVTQLFLSHPFLIYLKNKDNNNIEIPSVAFLGQPYELTPFTAAFGIKAASYRNFGPYYYISDYNTAIKEGSWTSNYLKRFLFGKSISDSNGKYYNGSIIRFAIFFGNFRTILYRPTDPFFSYFHALDNKYNLSDTSFKKFMDKSKNFTGQWANFYDALIIQNIKYKNYSGFYNFGSQYIIKRFDQLTNLSVHKIDKNYLKPVWVPHNNNYYIQ